MIRERMVTPSVFLRFVADEDEDVDSTKDVDFSRVLGPLATGSSKLLGA